MECQRKHWKSHKDVCKEIRVRAEAKKEADEAAGKALLCEQFRGALYGEKFARWCACPLDYRFSYTFFIFRRFMTF